MWQYSRAEGRSVSHHKDFFRGTHAHAGGEVCGGEGRESNPTKRKKKGKLDSKINHLRDGTLFALDALWATVAHLSKTPLIAIPSLLIKLGTHFL